MKQCFGYRLGSPQLGENLRPEVGELWALCSRTPLCFSGQMRRAASPAPAPDVIHLRRVGSSCGP